MRTAARVAAIVGAAFAIAAVPAAAQTDPYVTGTTGYDVSYPNCGATATGAFGVVGVNGGRPFTASSCLASEYGSAASTGSAALYINTAYSTAYRKSITSACSSASGTVSGTSSQRQAWAIGCSEAQTSLADASSAGASNVKTWWLDVETGNSWSSSNLALNRYAIQGATSRLAQTGVPVGVYSTAAMWKTITGGAFTPAGLDADWVAGAACGSPAFTSSPVWLAQSGSSGGIDSDTAC